MLSGILEECARLRGIPPNLIHRTLHEFDWFCTELIFQNTELSILNRVKYIEISKNFYNIHGHSKIDALGKSFLQYCIDEYGGDEPEAPSY